jgi:recombinational DNA repair protein (RecF pathway)
MEFEIGKCDACGQEQQVIPRSVSFEEKYCKKCYEKLHRKINCKFCGQEMQNHHYHKHIIDMHSE